jgi:hypothetical protein
MAELAPIPSARQRIATAEKTLFWRIIPRAKRRIGGKN